MILYEFLKDNIGDYVNMYSKVTGLEGFGLLYAHGVDSVKGWRFSDCNKSHSVQRWINEMDGRYNALVIDVCNPKSRRVYSKKSLVVAPNGVYSGLRQCVGMVQVELFVPKIGYLDGYIFDAELEDLKRRVK